MHERPALALTGSPVGLPGPVDMNATLLPYLPLFVFFLFAVVLGVGFVVASTFFGRRRADEPDVDLSAYECGLKPADPETKRFTVKFYLVAMLFILFDLEVAFLYPWAVTYKSLGWYGFWLMMVFLGLLTVGFIYVWARGALDWKESGRRRRAGAAG